MESDDDVVELTRGTPTPPQSDDKDETDFNEQPTLPVRNLTNGKVRRRIIVSSESDSDAEEAQVIDLDQSPSSSPPRPVSRIDSIGVRDSGSEEDDSSSASSSRSSTETDTESESCGISFGQNGTRRETISDRTRNRLKKMIDKCAPEPDYIDPHLRSIQAKQKSTSRKRKRTTKTKTTKRKKKDRENKKNSNNNNSESDGTESSGDDSMEDDDKRNHFGESQEVSIHLIDLQKFEEGTTEVQVIDQIIHSYNYPKPHMQTAHRFVKEKVSRIPKPDSNDAKLFTGKDFSVTIFTQEVKRRIGMLRAYKITKDTNLINTVMFYYRPGEIFALTTGQAWNCVQSFSDYDFPAKIAARLLSEKGQLETSSKAILGDELSTKRIMKTHLEKNPFDIVAICTSFSARLRARSSLLQFSGFGIKKGNCPETKVTVSFAHVRFNKRLNVSDFPCILSHFSKISKGEPTYYYKPTARAVRPGLAARNTDTDNSHPASPVAGSSRPVNVLQNGAPEDSDGTDTESASQEEELDSNAHFHNLTRVSRDMSQELNLKLAKLIEEVLRSESSIRISSQLDNFVVCHKHYTDFFNSEEIKVTYKNTDFEFNYVPTVFEVIDKLGFENFVDNVTTRGTRSINRRPGDDNHVPSTYLEDFCSELEKVKIWFKRAEGSLCKETKPEKLFNFLEGSFWNKEDGRVYWRVMSQWCSVRGSYLLIVHEQWLKMVQEIVMNEKCDGYLEIPWTPRVDVWGNPIHDIGILDEMELISAYIAKYTGQCDSRFYSLLDGRRRKSDDDEDRLGDMIYINDENEISIYYITRYLTYKSLRTRAQIMNFTTTIQNSLREITTQTTTPKRKAFKDQISQVYQRQKGIQEKFKKIEEFHSAVKNAKIIYAFGDDDGKMESEKLLNTKIDVQQIELILQSEKLSGTIGQTMFDALKKAKYLDATGCITPKLLICDFTTIDLNDNIVGSREKTNGIAWKIVQGLKSNYNGIQLKLELERVKRDLDGKSLKFLLCPIPVEKQVNQETLT